jgi:hypothetical protein
MGKAFIGLRAADAKTMTTGATCSFGALGGRFADFGFTNFAKISMAVCGVC